MEKVAAVILNYNSAKDCQKCVEYLVQQEYADFSIIIVDNNSSATGEQSKLDSIKEQYGVTLINQKENGGFSAGNNVGLRYAVNNLDADWCLVINPDVEIRDKNYISYTINESRKWEDAVVIGTNVVLPTGVQQNPMPEKTRNQEIFWMFEMIRKKIRKKAPLNIPSKTEYCEKICGCCFFIKSSFLQQIDFLDENVFLYCEEPILASRIKHNGKKALFIPGITAYHQHIEKEKSGRRKDKMLMMINSRIYWIKKYSDYGKFGRKIAVFSKMIERLFWKLVG